MGGDIGEAVSVATDGEGYADAEIVGGVGFDTVEVVRVAPESNGYITFIDYSSAGRTWDDDSRLSVWLPERRR